ncbi:hypothetical protein BH20ACT19_BH20ACT19_00270 [soil metagenome]
MTTEADDAQQFAGRARREHDESMRTVLDAVEPTLLAAP